MQSTLVYLEPGQKAELARRAKASGGSLSHEIRTAIDRYLADSSPAEWEALDALSRRAEQDLAVIGHELGQMRAMIRGAMAEIERIRSEPPLPLSKAG